MFNAFTDGRDLFRLDVAHNVDEHDFILRFNHGDDETLPAPRPPRVLV